jgi:polyisoprenoid-binding protein YceI
MLLAVAALLVRQTFALDAASATYHVDSTKSRATIHVGKAGAFAFIAGHTHEVSGPVQSGSVDINTDALPQSRVRLVIAAADLKVLPANEPEGDAPKVQEAMDSAKVLDVARYPRITLESTAVTVTRQRRDLLECSVTGRLTIRDVTHQVTVPVRVELAGGTLTATGRLTIKQSAFGIKPISVAGVVTVKDTLDIEFSISATR